MKDNESKRLLYKPVLEQQIKIDTSYNGGVNTNISKATRDNIEPPSQNNQEPENSNLVKAYIKYSLPRLLNQANDLNKEIQQHALELRNKLLQDDNYKNLVNADENSDSITLDNYRRMAENINGDIKAEIYPLIKNLGKELSQMIKTISDNEFNGLLDFDEMDMIILNDDTLKSTIAKNEKVQIPINYKQIEIDTQISKFVEDRVTLIKNMFRDLLNLQTPNTNVLVLLPKDKEFIQDYYAFVMETYNADKDKMERFSNTDAVLSTLSDVYALKSKVLKNRALLADASQDIFFGMLPLAKAIEKDLFNKMIDLYKATMLDEINKGDYINSLTRKEDIRQFYIDNVVDN